MILCHSPGRSYVVRILAGVVFALITFKLLFPSFLPLPLPQSRGQKAEVTLRPPASEIPIPRQIWQIFFAPADVEILDESVIFASEWVFMSPGYGFHMFNELDAAEFVDTTFLPSRPEIPATYHALRNPAAKSDFLRYLLLLARGGIYTDLDTQPLTRPEDWLPASNRRDTSLIIGLESDSTRDRAAGFATEPVQFCQFTIAAAPDHPLLRRMVDRTIAALQDLARRQNTTLDQAVLGDEDVIKASGPKGWSQVVLEWIKEMDASVTGLHDFQGMDEPRYYGDVAVLPVESFRSDYLCGWGLRWGTEKSRKCLVRHYFAGAWRSSKNTGSPGAGGG